MRRFIWIILYFIGDVLKLTKASIGKSKAILRYARVSGKKCLNIKVSKS